MNRQDNPPSDTETVDDEYLVPYHDRPENRRVHEVDDAVLRRHGIEKRRDFGVFIFS